MSFQLNPNHPLPKFRADLTLYKGPLDRDGSPTYSLFDPVRAQYYKITWRQSIILKTLKVGVTLNELCQDIESQSSVKITREDIKSFFEDALRYDLLETHKSAAHLDKESQRTKTNLLQKLFYKYLYMRVPLLQPDKFLNKTLPYVLPLASKTAFVIYFVLTVIGLAFLIDRFADYVNTFAYFFNFNGLLIYVAGIMFFKMIHELAHAYTACYHKVHVPSMGVALILFVPVLYTDTTDGWKLSKRNDRLKISAAGLVSELVLAGLCTFGWAVTSQGAFHSLFFVVSSVLWLSSVLINMNPAMRYDGYFLLSDWLGVDNLQSRAFNFTRWCGQRAFFGIDRASPEEEISTKLKVFFVIYSLFTWLYRLFFYFGLALLLYMFGKHYKIFGVLIFVMTIYTLILSPIFLEIMEIVRLKKNKHLNLNTGLTLAVVSVLCFFALFPLPKSLKLDAIASSSQEQMVYIPEDGKIDKILVKRGDAVHDGQPLIQLISDSLNSNIKSLEVKKKIVEEEIKKYERSAKELPLLKETNHLLASITVQLNEFYQKQQMLTVKSGINGKIISWDEGFKEGQYVHKGMKIGTIANPTFKVVAYVTENELNNLQENEKVQFRSDRTLISYKGTIEHINSVKVEYLKHASLASINKGNLPVAVTKDSRDTQKMKMLESMYVVDIALDNPNEPLFFGEQGTVKAAAPWNSYLDVFLKYLQRVFWRESGI